ncbi:Nuclear pore complex protein Nup98-Nup96 [Gigaspora margarita]|uniref:Nuclear pore complex protein Nup98-Nup96 n=1 Tax=Gigaspora margarita TaxID=4874 RepID=A0A8H3ZZZ9_GIGMA|nr:Nuclear pore complex protein Nup98-Nup96 [Gigaspora margarita]
MFGTSNQQGAFGQSAGTSGFGQSAQTPSLFGTNTQAPAFGGFGAGTSASTGTGGFGGFGVQNQTTSTFGFGAPASNPTGGGLFGTPTVSPFGGTGTSTATPSPPPNGTANPSYTTTSEKDPAGTLNVFHSISAMPAYRNFSFEELRLQDYQLNRKQLGTGSNFGGIGGVTPSFGATSTPSAFGAAPSGFGSVSPAFGAKSTTQPQPFAFGGGATATPAAGGFGAQVGPSSQLFGPQKPFGAPTGGFGTATQSAVGSGFGSGIGSGIGGGGGLFGATTTPATPPFGKTTTTAPAFGQNNVGFGGLSSTGFGFGNKTTTAASGFNITPSTTPAFGGFGATTTAPTNLFGASKPAFGFGTTATGGSVFGAAAPTTSAPSNLFHLGATTSAPSLGMGLFNKPPAPSFNLGTTTQTQPSSFNIGAPSIGFGATSITAPFGQPGPTQGFEATVDKSPYGDIPIYQTTSSMPTKPSVTATPLGSSPTKKKSIITSHKVTPKPTSKLKPFTLSSPTNQGYRPEVKPLHLFESGNQEDILSPDAFTRRNPRKLVLDHSVEPQELFPESDAQAGVSNEGQTPIKKSISFDSRLESGADTISHSFSPKNNRQVDTSSSSAIVTPTRISKTPLTSPFNGLTKEEEIFSSPILDNEYYSTPTIKDLKEMSPEQLKEVSGFQVGRKGYGAIEYPDQVDLSDVKPIEDILGKIIKFESQHCTVYGTEYNKPPPGQGLNKPAIISLTNCWALDKSNRQPVTDPEDPRYQQRIDRLKRVEGTKFITFIPSTGTWVFQVEHFTTYGLIFDDPEDQYEEKRFQFPVVLPVTEQDETKPSSQSRKGKEKEHDLDKLSPVINFSETLGHDPDVISEMQNFIFHSEDIMSMDTTVDDEEFDDSRKRSLGSYEDQNSMQIEEHKVESRKSFSTAIEIPQRDVVIPMPSKYRRIVDYNNSVVFGKNYCKEDSGLVMGRSFRVGWGPNGILVRCSKVCGISNVISAFSPKGKNTGLSKNTGMPSIIQFEQLRIFADTEDKEKRRHNRLMEFIFENSTIGLENGIPYVDTAKINFKSIMDAFQSEDIHRHEELIWKLGHALWDDITIPGVNQITPEVEKIALEKRKERISKWFKNAVSPHASVHVKLAERANNASETIFAYLSSKDIMKASKVAIKNRCFRLATLLSQLCGNDKFFRKHISDQIEHWKQTGVDKLISKDILKLYDLMIGNVIPSIHELDWKRALCMQMWYGSYLDESFDKSFDDYEKARKSAGIARPKPWYQDDIYPKPLVSWPVSDHEDIFDVHYHLLKLSVDPTHLLDDALLPLSITSSPLDYRVTWLLHFMLARTLTERDFVGQGTTADRVTLNLVNQLEVLGLHEWSLFAALFINEPFSRKFIICEILNRLVSSVSPERLRDVEKFASDQLKINQQLVDHAKALYSKYRDDTVEEAMYLLKSGNNADAHKIVISKIAPESILHKRHKKLQEILEKIDQNSVPDWDLGGKVRFIHLVLLCLLYSIVKSYKFYAICRYF